MITFERFLRLRHLLDQAHWKLQAVARELGLNSKTVRLWAQRVRYERKRLGPRSSKLDPFKNDIVRRLPSIPIPARNGWGGCGKRAICGFRSNRPPIPMISDTLGA